MGPDVGGPERPEEVGPPPRGLRLGYRDPALQGVVVAVFLLFILLFFTSIAPWVKFVVSAAYGIAWASLMSWRDRRGD